jgi:acyl-CoA synthetase (NDP forming)
VAFKASGLERLSKTEAGGVSLDVHGDDEVRHAYERMCELLGDAMRPAVVQVMVPEGVECRVGIYRHAVLGDAGVELAGTGDLLVLLEQSSFQCASQPTAVRGMANSTGEHLDGKPMAW